MLEHLLDTPEDPQRVVVVGAGGFVGGEIGQRLRARGIPVLDVARPQVDLLSDDAAVTLAALLRPSDSVVLASAIAPVKNLEMLQDNLTLISALASALETQAVAHVVNISSDAIYADDNNPLAEDSCAAPASLHGIMHWTRELVLAEAAGTIPFATLRSTLIYGARDPHNGYGPNRFRRLASAGEAITLFGEGEERRDHVDVRDVAELACLMLTHKSTGSLNAATGVVTSFRELAELVVELSGANVPIAGSPRVGPMPHNGYRPFDPSAVRQAFPGFEFHALRDGLAAAQQEAEVSR